MAFLRTGVIQPLPGIGDTIWLLPALRAFAAHAPDHKLTLFMKTSSLADILLADEEWVDAVIHLPKARGFLALLPNLFRTWRLLAKSKPDRLYVLHQSARYRWAAKLAGIREVVAYPHELATSKIYGWEKSLAFLQQLNIPVSNRYSSLRIDPERLTRIRQHFSRYPQPWFLVAPGSSETARCWPEDRFAACADFLVNSYGGAVFLTGSLQEAARIEAVYRRCQNQSQIIPAAGLPFDHFLSLIACCKSVLGNDSGPINIAAALGVPAFVLCGITAPALHSLSLIVIKPDLNEAGGNGMQRISVRHVTEIIATHFAVTTSKAEKLG